MDDVSNVESRLDTHRQFRVTRSAADPVVPLRGHERAVSPSDVCGPPRSLGRYRCHAEKGNEVDDEPRAGDLSSDEGRSSTGYRGVDGSGNPSRRISPEQTASEAALERLAEQAAR